MLDLREVFRQLLGAKDTPEISHGGEAIFLPHLWQRLCLQFGSHPAREGPHERDSIFLLCVWKELQE